MKKILICDDIEDIVELLRFTLEPEGFAVDTTNSAREAIFKIQQNQPDLLVSNVMMPDMSGYELAKYIQKNLKIDNLPILFITAINEEEFKRESLVQLSQVMFKPLDIQNFIDKIKSMLNEE
ncbi:response regulator receiver sensor signal transduction histidine kinase (plasmid) [Nostoc sp. HK-01]|nr:response regulator receiver sensor signal transduction histidine kinase [Nostoc sp. HK-01]